VPLQADYFFQSLFAHFLQFHRKKPGYPGLRYRSGPGAKRRGRFAPLLSLARLPPRLRIPRLNFYHEAKEEKAVLGTLFQDKNLSRNLVPGTFAADLLKQRPACAKFQKKLHYFHVSDKSRSKQAVGNYFLPVGSYFYPGGNYFRPISSYFQPIGNYFCSAGSYLCLSGNYFQPVGNYLYPGGNYFRPIGNYFYPIGNCFRHKHPCLQRKPHEYFVFMSVRKVTGFVDRH
jgi:hypothetical protein